MTMDDLLFLKDLSKKNLVTKAYKGQDVVILNTSEYINGKYL